MSVFAAPEQSEILWMGLFALILILICVWRVMVWIGSDSREEHRLAKQRKPVEREQKTSRWRVATRHWLSGEADLVRAAEVDRFAGIAAQAQQSLQLIAAEVEKLRQAVEDVAARLPAPVKEDGSDGSGRGCAGAEGASGTGGQAAVKAGHDESGVAIPAEFPMRVQKLFDDWCRESRKPAVPDWIDVRGLHFQGTQGGSELQGALLRFREGPANGDLVRFSRPGDTQALVFPNPAIKPDLTVVRLLYPEISPDSLKEPKRLVGLPPIPMQRRDNFWEKDA